MEEETVDVDEAEEARLIVGVIPEAPRRLKPVQEATLLQEDKGVANLLREGVQDSGEEVQGPGEEGRRLPRHQYRLLLRDQQM